MSRRFSVVVVVVLTFLMMTATISKVHAEPLAWNAAAATESFAPNTDLNAPKAVDGIFNSTSRGWAISGETGISQQAVFPLLSALSNTGLDWEITLDFHDPNESKKLIIGKFALDVTGDANPTVSGGNNWVTLTPTNASAASDNTLSIVNTTEILAGANSVPDFDTYTVSASGVAASTLSQITGFRLRALTDASLPGTGPGLTASGNFLLTNFTVEPVPEPTTWTLLGIFGLALLGKLGRRRS